jgi:S-adenosylmethionine hydrolase
MGLVVLLTDFGDGYFQGVMKGVILSRAPKCRIVDLDHHVRPGGILEAAYVLAGSVGHFPKSSIFCCVVDPGVGTARRRIVVESPSGTLGVGPDNGVLTALIGEGRTGATVREITNPAWFAKDDTRTFEGRSRFAPAAAALAAGKKAADAGPIVRDPVRVDLARSRVTRTGIAGEVVYVDPFGNLVTSIGWRDLDGPGPRRGLSASVGRRKPIPVRGTYADVPPGRAVAYVGSTGHLEIGIRGGSAAIELGVDVGAAVTVKPGKARP